jgi:hypothetical protein
VDHSCQQEEGDAKGDHPAPVQGTTRVSDRIRAGSVVDVEPVELAEPALNVAPTSAFLT